MQQAPYSFRDGSNDSGLPKISPPTIRMFGENRGNIYTRFLDMCSTSGLHVATAEPILTILIMFFVCIISHGTAVWA